VEKRGINSAESEIQALSKREFAKIKLGIKYMEVQNKMMRAQIEELAKEEAALVLREEESQYVYKLMKAFENIVE
jgi:predicted ATP-grasp superfamily ATP-dependent carboligase